MKKFSKVFHCFSPSGAESFMVEEVLAEFEDISQVKVSENSQSPKS